EGLLNLSIIITMMHTDMLYNGSRMVLENRGSGGDVLEYSVLEPVGSAWALWLAGLSLSNDTLRALLHLGFWWHASFVLIFLNILPYSKHFHIITAIINV